MKLLLDTHVFLWIIMANHNLSEQAREAYLNTDNQLYLSVASYWEICIKVRIGKLTLTPDWITRFDDEIRGNGIQWLTIAEEDCQRVIELPHLHKDPFDHLLIAQTLVHKMTLVTADKQIQQYQVPILW